MAYIKAFDPVVLTTVLQTLYTVPAAVTMRAGVLRFTNTTAGAVTVTVHAVPAAGTASDGNAFVKALSVPASDYYDVAIPILKAGDFLQALASANASITCHFLQGVVG